MLMNSKSDLTSGPLHLADTLGVQYYMVVVDDDHEDIVLTWFILFVLRR